MGSLEITPFTVRFAPLPASCLVNGMGAHVMAAEEQVIAARLVHAAQGGSRQAFAGLIRLHERTALGIAYAITGDSHAAGDVAQESFLRAWERLAVLRSPDRF